MGLLDDIKSEPRRLPAICSVKALLEKMPETEAQELLTALDDLTIQGSVIIRVLQRRGHEIKAGSLTRHRRKDCACHE
jgi:hypothetical protein